MGTKGDYGMARPTFQVTEKLSEKVKTMASVGVRQEQIAKALGVAPKTLRKHFRDELDNGAIEANVEVANTCYRMATSGTNTPATIFWLKVRFGWRENAPVVEKEATHEMPDFGVTGATETKREPLA
jgi:DNA-binding XRE family transcriptional regulator